ncbi:15521_t:CDS:2 [Funneliformis geosporum]|nr:15521_t:CDS:2 [Funneliformis geosporum]
MKVVKKRRTSSFDNKNPLHQHSHIKFSTSLTPDCFAEILVHLQDDKSTLYNCLFLNRLCCRLVVPLLWKRPFDLIQQTSHSAERGETSSSTLNSLERNATLIIKTYISCLPSSELQRYSKEGMIIPEMTRPLFDYPTYLKGFDVALLHSSIEYYFTKLLRNTRLMHYKSPSFNPSTYLAQWIVNKSNSLHSLNYQYVTEDALKSVDISSFKNIELKLQRLTKFDFIYFPQRSFINDIKPIISELFLTLSKTSTNIHEVKLILNKSSDPPIHQICHFLSSLRYLTTFKSNEFWLNDDPTFLDVFYSLSKHLNTLEYLEFSDLCHLNRPLLELLSNCKRLKVLEFKGFNLSQHRQQRSSSNDFSDYLFGRSCVDSTLGDSSGEYSSSNNFVSIGEENINPSYNISVENLIIHRNQNANSIIPLLNLISPFSLRKLYIENTTPEIINIISSQFISTLTHLSIRPSNGVSFATFATSLKKLLKRKDCNLQSFSLKLSRYDGHTLDDLRSIFGALQKRVIHLTLDVDGLCEEINSLQRKNKDIMRIRFIVNKLIADNVKNIVRNVKSKSKRNLEIVVRASNQLLADWTSLEQSV